MSEHNEIEPALIEYAHVITLTRYMADHGYTPDQIAYAVEKPHKHVDVLREALDQQDFDQIALRLGDLDG